MVDLQFRMRSLPASIGLMDEIAIPERGSYRADAAVLELVKHILPMMDGGVTDYTKIAATLHRRQVPSSSRWTKTSVRQAIRRYRERIQPALDREGWPWVRFIRQVELKGEVYRSARWHKEMARRYFRQRIRPAGWARLFVSQADFDSVIYRPGVPPGMVGGFSVDMTVGLLRDGSAELVRGPEEISEEWRPETKA